MNLAAVLGIYLLSVGLVVPGQETAGKQSQPGNAAVQPKPSPVPAKKSSLTDRRHKKKIPPCSNSPAALNPAADSSSNSANAAGNEAGNTGSSNANAPDNSSTDTASANHGSTPPLKPCPPPKKVVRNGGSNETSIQLVGGTPADQASQQPSTEQLTAATEENLKKLAGRQLNPNQQELVVQAKEYMDQSKTAVAAGKLESGHNFAMKANLLSQELLKP